MDDVINERRTFEQELESLINMHSKENESNTPDFILAEYLSKCLQAFNDITNAREKWYGRNSDTEINNVIEGGK